MTNFVQTQVPYNQCHNIGNVAIALSNYYCINHCSCTRDKSTINCYCMKNGIGSRGGSSEDINPPNSPSPNSRPKISQGIVPFNRSNGPWVGQGQTHGGDHFFNHGIHLYLDH